METLPQRLAELEGERQRPIRLVCRTDRRSAQAAQLLTEAGFADARAVQGGMSAWLARAYPSTHS